MLSYLLTLEYLKSMVYIVPAILLAISAHEFAHGYVSYKLGDPTPKIDGRLTLNPLAHLDLWTFFIKQGAVTEHGFTILQ